MSARGWLEGGGEVVRDPVVIGVVLGLVVGKPVGVLGGAWLVTRFTRAELNPSCAWRDLVGVGVLAGVGFTVALLVAELSFAGEDREREDGRARRRRWSRRARAAWSSTAQPPAPANA